MMRRTIPLAVTFIAGFLMIIDSIFNAPGFDKLIQTYLVKTVSVSTAFAIALGAMNLLSVHGRRFVRKSEGWGYSVVLWITFFTLLLLGVFLPKGNENQVYLWFYNNVNVSLNATMFSVLCFYIASAAYRAFRVRNAESVVLLCAAVLVMLGSVPIGEKMWSGFAPIKNWITDNATSSAMRGLSLGITLGALAQSIRNLLGIERGHLGGE